jgi:hypothetical protein
VEVVKKHEAKYLGDFLSNDTLDWEALMQAMAFTYMIQPCTEQQ